MKNIVGALLALGSLVCTSNAAAECVTHNPATDRGVVKRAIATTLTARTPPITTPYFYLVTVSAKYTIDGSDPVTSGTATEVSFTPDAAKAVWTVSIPGHSGTPVFRYIIVAQYEDDGQSYYFFHANPTCVTTEETGTVYQFQAVNEGPVAPDHQFDVVVGKTFRLQVATDDGDPMTIAFTTPPSCGTVVPNSDGTISFSSDAPCTTSFDYTVSDGVTTTAPATITLTATLPLALVKTTSLPVGDASCPTGGTKIESGLDDGAYPHAGNKVLDEDEVDAITYACNGATGAAGAAGETGAQGSAGFDSLVRVTEDTGTCVNGGSKIEVGPDANRNGALDSGEVTITTYACNGAQGSAGAKGEQGPEGPMGQPGGCSVVGGSLSPLALLALAALRRRRS